MTCFDLDVLDAAGRQCMTFLDRAPFPYITLSNVIHAADFKSLCETLPDLALFHEEFGKARDHGQQSHDRYALQYHPRLDAHLSPAWRDFIREIQGEAYAGFLRRMYGLGRGERFVLSMHWHFAPSGASVSPHTDASRKIGSHIFYLNTEADWEAAWGGQTLVLDGGVALSPHSSPALDAFSQVAASEILGNKSFLFKRTQHSWHAVKAIACPPGRLRKVFIVVINRVNFQVLWRRIRGKDPDGYRI